MPHHIDTRSSGEASICGDFAAHVHLDVTRSALFVGDVCGRGQAAGRAARSLQTYLHWALLNTRSLKECLRDVDSFFAGNVASEETPFASLFIAITNARTGSLSYASAGHEPGLLFDHAGKHRHLEPTAPVLGVQSLCRPVYHQRELPPTQDGLLVIVTDGITESRRRISNGWEMFGSAGVVRTVLEAARLRCDPANAIHQAARDHANGMLVDDASVAITTLTAGQVVQHAQLISDMAIRERRVAQSM